MKNYPKVDTGYIYPKMSKYIDEKSFTFDHKSEISIKEFEGVLGKEMTLVAHGVFNIVENFPNHNSTRTFINGEDFDGNLVDYIIDSSCWGDKDAEWVYCITYDGHIVKIGMTTTSLKERFISYTAGTRKNLRNSTPSTTNYVIQECNYHALLKGMTVEIHGIRIPTEYKTIEDYGVIKEIPVLTGKGHEEIITDKFISHVGHKPVLSVQKGNSSK